MGHYKVDAASKPGVLQLEIEGSLDIDEMRAFVREHNAAIDALHGAPYRVFCNLRNMQPLSPESSQLFLHAKQYSASHANFEGSAVLIASSLIAMQHRRTSVEGGVMSSELISDDEAECWAHLRTIQRSRKR
jgi:hypothetical protein